MLECIAVSVPITLAERTAETDFCGAKTILVSAQIVVFIGPYIAWQKSQPTLSAFLNPFRSSSYQS